MNDNAKAWVAALRSGKYKQATGYLRREDDRFCCLGVACELAVEAGVIEPPELSKGSYEYLGLNGSYEYLGLSDILPTQVQDWLGLASERGRYRQASNREEENLASKNDHGASFEEIADLIESKPEGLFT